MIAQGQIQDRRRLFLAGEDDTVVLLLEPDHGVLGGESVLLADLGLASSSLGDTVAGSLHDDVEVHTVDT